MRPGPRASRSMLRFFGAPSRRSFRPLAPLPTRSLPSKRDGVRWTVPEASNRERRWKFRRREHIERQFRRDISRQANFRGRLPMPLGFASLPVTTGPGGQPRRARPGGPRISRLAWRSLGDLGRPRESDPGFHPGRHSDRRAAAALRRARRPAPALPAAWPRQRRARRGSRPGREPISPPSMPGAATRSAGRRRSGSRS